MNNSIYINSNNSFLTSRYSGNSGTSLYEKGNVITGTISSIDSNIAILKVSEKHSINFPAGSIIGNVGDEVSFEVMGNSNEGLSLKQIFSDKSTAYTEKLAINQSDNDSLMDLFKQHNMATDENMYDTDVQEKELEEDLKVQQAIRKIRNQLAFSTGNSSSIAISELAASGLSASKIDLTTLNSVMQEIDAKPPLTLTTDENGNIISNKPLNQNSETIQKLTENDILANEKNINSLNTFLSKLDEISNLDSNAIKEFVQSEKPLTLENVYVSKFSATSENSTVQNNPSLWNDLKGEVLKIFDKNDIDVNSDTLKAAKFLIDNELPVQQENVENVVYLQNVSDSTNRDFFIQEAIANIQSGSSSSHINLTATSNAAATLYKDYQKVINALPSVTGEKINVMLNQNIPLTLNNITNSQSDLEIDESSSLSTADNLITAKRQIAEIALKLTSESAYRLSGKNLNINTMPLEEALNTLKELELESYNKNLKIMGAEVSVENADKMATLFNQVETIKQHSFVASLNILDKSSSFTIEDSANTINSLQTAKVLKDFEDFATTIMPKYGDSFQNVKEQFGDLLDNLSIPVTESNIKSAQILSKAGVDINLDNILQIDTIMSKLDRVANTLHPNIAANLIKDGLNPSTMHVDEVLSYIDEFGGQYGENLRDKIPKHIMETDNNENLSADVREGMIAVYRMLHTIEKNDSVALGVTLKSGTDVTLGNLLESSKYYTRTKGKTNDIDFSAGDDETNRVRIANSENNIKSILENSKAIAYKNVEENGTSKEAVNNLLEQVNMGETADNINKAKMVIDNTNSDTTSERLLTEFEYNHENVETFSNKSNPENLSKLMPNNIDGKNITDLLNEIKNFELESSVAQNSDNLSNFTENINNDLSEISHELLNFMNENSVPLTLNYSKPMNNFSKNPHYMGDVVGELSENLSKSDMTELLDLLNVENLKSSTPEEILQKTSEFLDEIAVEQTNAKDIENLNIAKLAVDSQSIVHQNNKGNWLGLPVSFNESVAGLNMYVVNDDIANSTKNDVYFSLNTENLGNVQLFAKVDGNSMSLSVICDSAENAEFLNGSSTDLLNALNSLGLNVDNIEFNIQNVETATTNSNVTDNSENSSIYGISQTTNSNIEVIV